MGKDISYSFSKNYFGAKFDKLGLDHLEYINFDLANLNGFKARIRKEFPVLSGLNVTIPYKEQIIPHLDVLDAEAAEIGAVNTIKFLEDGSLKGFNTDVYGFKHSLIAMQGDRKKKALILGTGGASKAIYFVLKQMNIRAAFVSRTKNTGHLIYSELNKEIIESHELIVNCSPLGTFPDVDKCPDIPYEYLSDRHLLYDLIYNPEKTKFLQLGEQKGAKIMNGLAMLELQAERSWEIWNGLV